MPISHLSLTDFRNLNSTTLDFHPRLNLISGNNGSGKTSLLEAIHVLCHGCTFRNHQLKKAISHNKTGFLLFGRFDDYKAGISKTEKKLEIRIDGEKIKKRSKLVNRTPINIVNTDSLELIIGPPQKRRQYIDWSLFHVEQTYNEYWIKYRHALKQRNKLLKRKRDLFLLDYWDKHLIQAAIVLLQYRMEYSDEIKRVLANEVADLLNDIDISTIYQMGWNDSLSLKEALEKDRDRDIRAGFTHSGVHRDNLVILSEGLPATEVLSRGQLKRASLALLLAALKIVKKNSNRQVILLIDDLQAEIDVAAQANIYKTLLNIDLQLFITGIEDAVPEPLKGKEFKMFHVEHGTIRVRKFC
ncbi:MAG: DNA replication/repair protein RecF [Gammaproteobacteria bacterium]|nr:DNA replication/repair protein RecF [Gammaproteobacteria bacterium]